MSFELLEMSKMLNDVKPVRYWQTTEKITSCSNAYVSATNNTKRLVESKPVSIKYEITIKTSLKQMYIQFVSLGKVEGSVRHTVYLKKALLNTYIEDFFRYHYRG